MMDQETIDWLKFLGGTDASHPGNKALAAYEGAMASITECCEISNAWMEKATKLQSLVLDYKDGIDSSGAVAWSKEEAAAWHKAATEALDG